MLHGSTSLVPRYGRVVAAGAMLALIACTSTPSRAGDWPQWRGVNREARATDFKAPETWPKALKQKWKVEVGDGVATPALVGDKLYVFAREGKADTGAEVTYCLDAASGKELWKESNKTVFKASADGGFPGPRSSPAVGDGKVVTFGVNGTLSCLKADNGEKIWRIETGATPRFHTSSSPVIVGDLVVVQYGSEARGGVAAYELSTGAEKWKWADEGAAYASLMMTTVSDVKMVVAETDRSVVGVGLEDGKKKWITPYPLAKKGPNNYNSSTPAIHNDMLIVSGANRGTRAFKVEKKGDEFSLKELWHNKEQSSLYCSPVIKNGLIFGMTSGDSLFCLKADTGETAWTAPISGGRGYCNIVDAGSVMIALTPGTNLVVFEPSEKDYKELAKYKVGDAATYAYPIATANRIYIKDKNSVILYTVE